MPKDETFLETLSGLTERERRSVVRFFNQSAMEEEPPPSPPDCEHACIIPADQYLELGIDEGIRWQCFKCKEFAPFDPHPPQQAPSPPAELLADAVTWYFADRHSLVWFNHARDGGAPEWMAGSSKHGPSGPYESAVAALLQLYQSRPPQPQEGEPDLNTCPGCGGPSGGHDRCDPPSPYYCDRCDPPQPAEGEA